MKLRWLCMLVLGAVACTTSSGRAAEPYRQFVQELRNRGYMDYALYYLDQIESRDNVPAEIRAVIPYERAVTHLEISRRLQTPEAQNEQLEEAMKYLQQFTKLHPEHPQAGQADTQRGQILLDMGRVEVWQSKLQGSDQTKSDSQKRARELVGQARKIFQAAHDKHQAAYKKFPTFVDAQEDKQLFAERKAAENRYMRAQYDLAMCTYEKSQTYDVDSPEYKKISDAAAVEFETIHTKYRSIIVGLYSRLWQGKCFEEQGDLRKATGIYNEMLGHPGTTPSMQRLKDLARQFRLICNNHDDRQEYQLVIQEANEWLANSRGKQKTPIGLGIRWELAKAQKAMGSKRELSEAERTDHLKRAKTNFDFITDYPGQYQDAAMAMVGELQIALGDEAGDPKDFNHASTLARKMVAEIDGFQDQADAETDPKTQAQLKEDLRQHLDETGRMLKLALNLVDEKVQIADVNQMRWFLSYVYYLRGQSYEAAVLGEYVARKFSKDDSKTATECAYLAMGAYVQMYTKAPKNKRDTETKLITRICHLIVSKWPESDRADEARMRLGQVYSQSQMHTEAADTYSKVTAGSPQYAAAQIAAGQAYWSAYVEAAPQPEQFSADDLREWQTKAQERFQTGIEKTDVPEGKPAPAALIAAKVSLANIQINTGREQEAVETLTGEPHQVTKAIAVDEGQKRPEKGIQSAEFAVLTYQLLLRAHVGLQQTDQALLAMQALERIGGSDSTAIYMRLGRELKSEIERRQAAGDIERLTKLRQSFQAFLDKLFELDGGKKYSSLIWIAETYFNLGEGMGKDDPSSAGYYKKAVEGYEAILKLAKDKPGAVKPTNLPGVKMRLVSCKRQLGDFEKALKLVIGILKQNPNNLTAQFEAAYTLQDWGTSGQGDSYKKLVNAINGTTRAKKKGPIWGWGQISRLLQRKIDPKSPDPQMQERFLEARYNISWCRYQFGKAQSKTDKKKKILRSAITEIEAFAFLGGNIDDKSWAKFDSLYQTIQKDLDSSKSPKRLERPKRVVNVPSTTNGEKEPKIVKPPPPPPPPPTPAEGPSMLLVIGAVLLAAGGAVAFVFLTSRTKKRRPRVAYAATAPMPGGKRRTKPRPVGAAAAKTTSAAKPVRRRPPGTGSGESSPRKKWPPRPKPTP